MGLFKRSGDRPAAPGAEHPVFGLRVGMERDTVIDRLGPPSKTTTAEEVFSQYTVIGAKPDLDKEFWLYKNVPSRGHVTHIAIAHGVLETVKVSDTRERRDVWSLP